MKTWAKDMKDAETFEKFFAKVKSDCKKEHAVLGFRRICQDGRHTKEAKAWFESLRKFPIARVAIRKRTFCTKENSFSLSCDPAVRMKMNKTMSLINFFGKNI